MVITVVTHSEFAWFFIVAGLLGILIYTSPWRHRNMPPSGTPQLGLLPWPLISGLGFLTQRLASGCC
jgi:hypothetical protein